MRNKSNKVPCSSSTAGDRTLARMRMRDEPCERCSAATCAACLLTSRLRARCTIGHRNLLTADHPPRTITGIIVATFATVIAAIAVVAVVAVAATLTTTLAASSSGRSSCGLLLSARCFLGARCSLLARPPPRAASCSRGLPLKVSSGRASCWRCPVGCHGLSLRWLGVTHVLWRARWVRGLQPARLVPLAVGASPRSDCSGRLGRARDVSHHPSPCSGWGT